MDQHRAGKKAVFKERKGIGQETVDGSRERWNGLLLTRLRSTQLGKRPETFGTWNLSQGTRACGITNKMGIEKQPQGNEKRICPKKKKYKNVHLCRWQAPGTRNDGPWGGQGGSDQHDHIQDMDLGRDWAPRSCFLTTTQL